MKEGVKENSSHPENPSFASCLSGPVNLAGSRFMLNAHTKTLASTTLKLQPVLFPQCTWDRKPWELQILVTWRSSPVKFLEMGF